jgi:hypothetical protein
MSFGYSVGDFIAIGTLSWEVYKSCKEAPGSFKDISSKVLSLHVVLKEAEETVFAHPLSTTKQERLKAVRDGCYQVLTDLDALLKKYQSLGTQNKRTWDPLSRMRWGAEDIAQLRARLTSNTALLTAWVRCVREFLANLRPIANLLAHLRLMSPINSMTICRSLEKENDKGL